jgi:NADPH:quinone reductase-like Zn-dependent oxidoreductase
MKAAIRRSFGTAEKINIEEHEKPVIKDNEVLIKVYATTVNRTDCANLTAKPFIMRFVVGFFGPKKIILGTDFAGQVVQTGKNVTAFKVNDKVFGFNDFGLSSQAEYISMPEDGNLLLIPEGINFKQAAASLEGAHYAYTFIHKVNILPGQSILINGATGAIGSALLQFVKQYDIKVAATCNTRHIDLVRSLGADKIYDYSREDFTKDSKKYNFIFDAAGKSTFGKCKPVLTKGGIYISSEPGPFAQNLVFAVTTKITGSKKVIFPVPYSIKETMPYISKRLTEGIFNPVIDREYSLEHIAEAYTYVLAGQKTGNVVICISS